MGLFIRTVIRIVEIGGRGGGDSNIDNLHSRGVYGSRRRNYSMMEKGSQSFRGGITLVKFTSSVLGTKGKGIFIHNMIIFH